MYNDTQDVQMTAGTTNEPDTVPADIGTGWGSEFVDLVKALAADS
jgi:hypothetical protein